MRVRTMAGMATAVLVGYLMGAVSGPRASERFHSVTGNLATRFGPPEDLERADEKDEADSDEHNEVVDTTTVLARVNSGSASAA